MFVGQTGTNTISISNASFVKVEHLTLLGDGQNTDAVKAEGTSKWAHHITLETLVIRGYNASQQDVAISDQMSGVEVDNP